jgi:hypothetical protein
MNEWLRTHPYTCVYIALWLTVILMLQIAIIARAL